MRIGGIGSFYPNFVYNTNAVSANSMNKLSKISDNVLDKKVDYEANTEENQNPLRKGETKDFQGILAKQMQEGQNRAAAIFSNKQADSVQSDNVVSFRESKEKKVQEPQVQNQNQEQLQQPQNQVSYQMQRAMQAYELFTAV